ncbi:MAG TPA: ATP-binding cassette domain-containing protein, partial [Oligoflexia bacterium]|nr:ATP-binding cassette domain-containing protein [Oligoflexia bacterium]
MIALTSVSKTYPQSAGPVFDNVTLKINKGEFLYIVGDSGAGKTTLLKMLCGEETPTRGTVQVFGEDISKMAFEKVQATRRRIGVIFQELRLVEDLTAYDNVALALHAAGDTERYSKRAIDEALALVNLSRLAHKKVAGFSGGEKQRVAAARAIVRQPEILLADEPTGSLDRDHTWSLMDLFQKLHLRGTTILVATHDREIVPRVRRRS